MIVCGGIVSSLLPTHIAVAEGAPYCAGEYAEDLLALSPHAREVEARAAPYSYAVRTAATYECVAYGTDGNLKKTQASAVAYGTAFGYRQDGGDTLLATNAHVAEWPAVTDDDHLVDGIPAGCKRIADSLKIVDDDHDDYAADDVPLVRVISDPALDVAVLRAHAKLETIPWRIGKSATLAAREVVEVKGFPLGEFRATNVGKVISAYAHDDQGEWNHDDFVIDALLTSGGSGSPVLAVSCATGEFELVGIFHARFTNASALNVVIAIDQARDLLTTLKRTSHPAPEPALDAAARAHLAESVHNDPDPAFFAIGQLPASVFVGADGRLVFVMFSSDFPRTTAPLLVIEDLADDDPKTFGRLGSVYVHGDAGLRLYAPADADAESQAVLARALGLFRRDALDAFEWDFQSCGRHVARCVRADRKARTHPRARARSATRSHSNDRRARRKGWSKSGWAGGPPHRDREAGHHCGYREREGLTPTDLGVPVVRYDGRCMIPLRFWLVIEVACSSPAIPHATRLVIDRFSAAAGHLMVRDANNKLPAPDQPIDLDQPPFVTQGLGPDGSPVRYYNFDVQAAEPATRYRLVRAGNHETLPGEHDIVEVIPGDRGYSDFWRIAWVEVPIGYVAGSITDAAEIRTRGYTVVPDSKVIDCPILPPGSHGREGHGASTELWYRGARVSCLEFGSPLGLDDGRVPTSPIYVTFTENPPAGGPRTGFRTESSKLQTHNVVFSVPGDLDYSPLWAVHIYDRAAFASVHDAKSALEAPILEPHGPLVNCPIVFQGSK